MSDLSRRRLELATDQFLLANGCANHDRKELGVVPDLISFRFQLFTQQINVCLIFLRIAYKDVRHVHTATCLFKHIHCRRPTCPGQAAASNSTG
jgi:hypothetical protein